MLFVLSWQNQLLAKGLSFVEEKIKESEGKYEGGPGARGRDSAPHVCTAEMLVSESGRLPVSESRLLLAASRGLNQLPLSVPPRLPWQTWIGMG